METLDRKTSLVEPEDPAASPDNSLFRAWLPVALFLTVLAFSVPTVPSADIWWHLSSGHYILQNKSVPRVDPFSATLAGKRWIAEEWLSDVIFFAVYSVAGSAGLLFLAGIVITLSFWLAYVRSGGPTLARILALALGIWAASPIFCVRPQVFTYFLVAVFLLIQSRYVKGASYKWLVVLPLLVVLWVNLHGAYILGPALIVLFALGVCADGLAHLEDFAATKRHLRDLSLAFLGTLVVVPLNPNGFTMYSYPFATLHSWAIQTQVMEWRSPDFHLPIFYPLAALMFLTVAVLALAPSRPRPSQVLLFVFFALATLRSMRNLPLFILVAFPLLAEYSFLPAWKWPAVSPSLQKYLKLAAVLLAAAVASQMISGRIADQLEIEKVRFPARAVAFLEAKQLPAPIFNSYDFGGYLIWKLYPRYRVYIDGRTDLYGDDFIKNFLEVYEVNADPRPVLDRDGIRTIIVEPGSNLATFLRGQSNWNRVYEDPIAVIFSR